MATDKNEKTTTTSRKNHKPRDPNAPPIVRHRIDYGAVDAAIVSAMRSGITAPDKVLAAALAVDPALRNSFVRARIKVLAEAGVNGVSVLGRTSKSAIDVERLNSLDIGQYNNTPSVETVHPGVTQTPASATPVD